MKALFVELPAFTRHRPEYLTDEEFASLQVALLKNMEAGKVIRGSGGIRKLRFSDARRGKGKRGGLRVIYFWWEGGSQCWLFAIYDKDEVEDLTANETRMLRALLKAELEERQ
jgi:hypothetical protein